MVKWPYVSGFTADLPCHCVNLCYAKDYAIREGRGFPLVFAMPAVVFPEERPTHSIILNMLQNIIFVSKYICYESGFIMNEIEILI
ncbi:MAG: hypothetical protein LBL76_08160 [Treponema sp.]|jgi:hypothetical protein|nr:hypothetical protein [Treponema sp.]